MTVPTQENPFHRGERAAQMRAGVGDVSQWAGAFVRDYLPEQHRDFFSALPFLVVAGRDEVGRTWATVVEGDAHFIESPDPRQLCLRARMSADDPLSDRFARGGDIGAVGIELHTRRRNRFSGHLRPGPDGFAIDISQSFGNCPQYIHERELIRVPRKAGPVRRSEKLDGDQIARIRAADTLFIGSGHQGAAGAASNGFDASHRGGAAGFVDVADNRHLTIPDYAGNNFFNTIGNILCDPRVGLLFVDFETGGLLHVSGRAQVDWTVPDDPQARRMIRVEIDAVIDRPGALSLRWSRLDRLRRLRLERRQAETADITSFHFAPADDRPLDPFLPGQHLPVAVQVPGQAGLSRRSYSLSGIPGGGGYRLSIKREDRGLVSRFLHDHLQTGEVIEAQPPAGEFVIPDGDRPLVLISAGVGVTPMIPMLHALAGGSRPVWFVHGARNGQAHALSGEVATLVAQHANLHRRVFYSKPQTGDVAGRDYDVAGRVTADGVVTARAEYMLCGPARFLADLRAGLEAAGVPADRIHYETFGPAG